MFFLLHSTLDDGDCVSVALIVIYPRLDAYLYSVSFILDHRSSLLFNLKESPLIEQTMLNLWWTSRVLTNLFLQATEWVMPTIITVLIYAWDHRSVGWPTCQQVVTCRSLNSWNASHNYSLDMSSSKLLHSINDATRRSHFTLDASLVASSNAYRLENLL